MFPVSSDNCTSYDDVGAPPARVAYTCKFMLEAPRIITQERPYEHILRTQTMIAGLYKPLRADPRELITQRPCGYWMCPSGSQVLALVAVKLGWMLHPQALCSSHQSRVAPHPHPPLPAAAHDGLRAERISHLCSHARARPAGKRAGESRTDPSESLHSPRPLDAPSARLMLNPARPGSAARRRPTGIARGFTRCWDATMFSQEPRILTNSTSGRERRDVRRTAYDNSAHVRYGPHVLALCDTHDRFGPRTFAPSSVTRRRTSAFSSRRYYRTPTCAWVHRELLCSLRPALDVPSASTTSNPASRALRAIRFRLPTSRGAGTRRCSGARMQVPRIIGAASLERNALARHLAYSRTKHGAGYQKWPSTCME
ncbi:hypothetical protein C8R44DRAFT_894951 [Mycena epipterygia]|nr:hypothetical protein C8R44DRAFT_894951 [Mycena epipterygia]